MSLSPICDRHPTSSTPLRMYLARPRLRSVGLVRRPTLPSMSSRLEAREPAPRCASPFACVLCASYPGPAAHACVPRARRHHYIPPVRVPRAPRQPARRFSYPRPRVSGPRSACGCWCAREVVKAQGVVCVRVWHPIGVSYMQATSGRRNREGEVVVLTCCAALRRKDGRRVWRADTGTFYVV
jgi:hypothetical protein